MKMKYMYMYIHVHACRYMHALVCNKDGEGKTLYTLSKQSTTSTMYTNIHTVGVIIKFPFRFCYRSVFFRFTVVLPFLLPSVTVCNRSVYRAA